MCIVLIQGNEKSLMKFAAVSEKMLKIAKCLPKVLFNIGIMAFCLFPCFCILFARQLESITKVFTSKIVLASLKNSELVDAY